jgi:hypothetical protein
MTSSPEDRLVSRGESMQAAVARLGGETSGLAG